MSPLLFRRASDEALGSRLASGEAAAFDELYRRYVHRLAAYGTHLLGDGAAGDDVAQVALLKAYTALRAGNVPSAMRAWLYRIAHNAAIDTLAKRREQPWAEVPDQQAGESSAPAGALLAALAALPDRQRRVYLLREVHGLRIDETASELGLSATQVEQALFAARNRLAEHLVFGDRLDCVTVQRLSAGPLAQDERRALKTHLRSCPACRSKAGLRDRASALPVHVVGWLRGLLTGIGGGGAPVAAKVTAVVATSGLAIGVPEVAHLTDRPTRGAAIPQHVTTTSPRAAVAVPHVPRDVSGRAAVLVASTTRPRAHASILPVRTPRTRVGELRDRTEATGERQSGRGATDDTGSRSAEVSIVSDGSRESGSGGGDRPESTSGGDRGSSPTPTTLEGSRVSSTSDGHGSGESRGETTTTSTTTTVPTSTVAPAQSTEEDGHGGDGGGTDESHSGSGHGDSGDSATSDVAGQPLPSD